MNKHPQPPILKKKPSRHAPEGGLNANGTDGITEQLTALRDNLIAHQGEQLTAQSSPADVTTGESTEAPPPTDSPDLNAASDSPPPASPPPTEPGPAAVEGQVTLSAADLEQLYERAAAATTLEEQLTASQQALEAAQTQLGSSQAQTTQAVDGNQALLTQIGQLLQVSGAPNQPTSVTGRPNGSSDAYSGMNFNNQLSQSDKVEGLMADCLSAYESASPIVQTTKSGGTIVTRDTAQLSVLVRDHWSDLLPSLEQYAKRNGMLRGAKFDSLAATQGSDIPVGFLPVLSAKMRWTQLPQYIHASVPRVRFDVQKSIGDTMQVARSPYEPEPTSADDYRLSGKGNFVQITAERGNVRTGDVPITLEEWGRGKDPTIPPLSITSFLQAYSVIDVLDLLMRNLRVNHMAWKDKAIRELIARTSVAYYNNGGVPTQLLGDLANGSDGRLVRQYLANLYAQMRALQVPTVQAGLYRINLNTFHATTLKESLKDQWESPTPEQLMAVTNMLNLGRQDAMRIQQVDGFLGIIENFMCFETNVFGLGLPGTEGVNSLATSDGTHTFRSSYAMGADILGEAMGMPFEVRGDEFQDFGRIKSFNWFEHSGRAPLDLDPVAFGDTSAVPQQLRCFEIRATREAI